MPLSLALPPYQGNVDELHLQPFWGDLSGVPRSSLTTSALAFLGNGGDQGVDVKGRTRKSPGSFFVGLRTLGVAIFLATLTTPDQVSN